MTGSLIVTLALAFYTLALISEVRKHTLSKSLLVYFNVGLVMDISATCFMIAGSTNSPFTVHGFIGYSALTAMLIEVFLLWRLFSTNKINSTIPASIHKYTLFAFTWWVLAFITGGLISALN